MVYALDVFKKPGMSEILGKSTVAHGMCERALMLPQAANVRLLAARDSINAEENHEAADDRERLAAAGAAHHQLARQAADNERDADHNADYSSHGEIMPGVSECRKQFLFWNRTRFFSSPGVYAGETRKTKPSFRARFSRLLESPALAQCLRRIMGTEDIG
jgi:hypothetical protein